MSKALGLISNNGYASIENGLENTYEAYLAKDNNVTLFRYEDMHAWVLFTCVFAVLITFDNVILNRNPQALTMKRAVLYSLFWMVMALGFCGWVSYAKGTSAGYMWASGYLLEWMLSFDNLFVFHMIFSVYGCPDQLKHRPLYMGIMGAVVFRLVFIFMGEYLMHAFSFMHLIFGAFLIWTGIQTVSGDEEDEDPSQQPFVVWLQSKVSFVSVYCVHGSFFVKVPLNEEGEALIPEEAYVKATETSPLVNDTDEQARYPVVDFEVANRGHQGRVATRATMLFLVVLCLEISDVLFAVDSVSAIVSAVNDLFLAYTSTVFAMLGLRAMFFVIDVLVKLFSLLKYGVALVLVFVGVKLMVGRFYHIPTGIVCLVLVSTIGGSMLASVIKETYFPDEEEEDAKPSAKASPAMTMKAMKASPFASPACTPIMPQIRGTKLP